MSTYWWNRNMIWKDKNNWHWGVTHRDFLYQSQYSVWILFFFKWRRSKGYMLWLFDKHQITPMLIFLIPEFFAKNAQVFISEHKMEYEGKQAKVERYASHGAVHLLILTCEQDYPWSLFMTQKPRMWNLPYSCLLSPCVCACVRCILPFFMSLSPFV